jgi:hypothetical protein
MPSSVAPASSRRSVSWSQTGNRRASDPGRGSGTFRENHGTDFRSRYTQRNRLAPRDVRKTRNPVDRCRPHHLSAARRRRATYSNLDRCQMVRGRVRRTSTTSLSASVISFIGHPSFNHVGTVDNRKRAKASSTSAVPAACRANMPTPACVGALLPTTVSV